MSLAEQQRVMVQLMMSAPFRRAFFAAPPDAHAQYGLTPDEFQALRRIDERRVAVFNQVYAGKRFDYLNAAFPRTLALLEARDPLVRARYAEEVPLVDDARVEFANFHRWARARPVPPEERARLEALCDWERLARTLPLAPRGRPFRLADDVRPLATGCAVPVDLAADVTLLAEGREPGAAAASSASGVAPGPARVLVWNDEGKARAERLDPSREALLAACDGKSTLAELVSRFGAEARDPLARWLVAGVLALA